MTLSLDLFDTSVEPVLIYEIEVWGVFKAGI